MTDCGIPSAVDKEIIAAKKSPWKRTNFLCLYWQNHSLFFISQIMNYKLLLSHKFGECKFKYY